MIISEKKLRRIVNEILNEFRFPEKGPTILSSQEISFAIDKAMAGRHASGRKFHPAFKQISENDARITTDVYNMSADQLAEVVKKLSKEIGITRVKQITKPEEGVSSLLNADVLHDLENTVLMSILLFTDGSVKALRDPDEFDDLKANKIYGSEITPKKVDYELANYVMSKLATAKMKPTDIYRGMGIDENVVKNLRPGIEFNNFSISSWSKSLTVAERFATHESETYDKGIKKLPLVLHVPSSEVGCYIAKISGFPSEEEVIMGKQILIKKVEEANRSLGKYTLATCEIVSLNDFYF